MCSLSSSKKANERRYSLLLSSLPSQERKTSSHDLGLFLALEKNPKPKYLAICLHETKMTTKRLYVRLDAIDTHICFSLFSSLNTLTKPNSCSPSSASRPRKQRETKTRNGVLLRTKNRYPSSSMCFLLLLFQIASNSSMLSLSL
jgi:hypothetical protein